MNQALLELHPPARTASRGGPAANVGAAQTVARRPLGMGLNAGSVRGAQASPSASGQPAERRAAAWAAQHGEQGPQDATGFDIGWDHAHFGLVPPAGLLLDDSPICQGWSAGKSVFKGRTLAPKRHTRQWLQLRLLAWRQGLPFEAQQLGPNFLAQIEAPRCPVTRQALQGAAGQADSLVVQRLNQQAGYAAGNLATISQAAAQALDGLSVADGVRQARALEAATARLRGDAGGDATRHAATKVPSEPDSNAAPAQAAPLTAARWWRLTVLRSFATPLPFGEAARLPLAVLPPNRVRLLNPVQGLQALLTRNFLCPGWAERCRALAQQLPEHSLRHDFNLFIGALVPRVLEAGTGDAPALRHALEDAWLQDRVQRRWQHLVFSLGEQQTETLLQLAVAVGIGSVRTLNLSSDQATEGWALPSKQSGRCHQNLGQLDAD